MKKINILVFVLLIFISTNGFCKQRVLVSSIKSYSLNEKQTFDLYNALIKKLIRIINSSQSILKDHKSEDIEKFFNQNKCDYNSQQCFIDYAINNDIDKIILIEVLQYRSTKKYSLSIEVRDKKGNLLNIENISFKNIKYGIKEIENNSFENVYSSLKQPAKSHLKKEKEVLDFIQNTILKNCSKKAKMYTHSFGVKFEVNINTNIKRYIDTKTINFIISNPYNRKLDLLSKIEIEKRINVLHKCLQYSFKTNKKETQIPYMPGPKSIKKYTLEL